jgi:hypothetical protein
MKTTDELDDLMNLKPGDLVWYQPSLAPGQPRYEAVVDGNVVSDGGIVTVRLRDLPQAYATMHHPKTMRTGVMAASLSRITRREAPQVKEDPETPKKRKARRGDVVVHPAGIAFIIDDGTAFYINLDGTIPEKGSFPHKGESWDRPGIIVWGEMAQDVLASFAEYGAKLHTRLREMKDRREATPQPELPFDEPERS